VAVATAVLALFPSSASMLAVQPLIAIGFSLLFVGQSRLLAAAVPAGLQASAQTLGSALTGGVGGLIAGVVGGRVADSLGYGGLFSCLVVLAVVGSAVGGVALLRARRSGVVDTEDDVVAGRVASPGCTVPANQ
jgi:MFS family permease